MIEKLIEEFAFGTFISYKDVSSILKKTQNTGILQAEPLPSTSLPDNAIITNFQSIRDYIGKLKNFIIGNLYLILEK